MFGFGKDPVMTSSTSSALRILRQGFQTCTCLHPPSPNFSSVCFPVFRPTYIPEIPPSRNKMLPYCKLPDIRAVFRTTDRVVKLFDAKVIQRVRAEHALLVRFFHTLSDRMLRCLRLLSAPASPSYARTHITVPHHITSLTLELFWKTLQF